MFRFLKNILLFILPLVLMISPSIPIYFMAKETGEFNAIADNAEKQRGNHDCLLGLGYNEQTAYYKLLNTNFYQTPVISLGTSRVMQFKDVFFSSEFYNCGGAVGGNYNQYRNYLENLCYTPEIVLLGIDTWVFNDAWNSDCVEYESFQEIRELDRGTITLMKSIFKDWLLGKWDQSDLSNYPVNIGFNGRVKDNGFMYDGSYYYGDLYRDPASSADYEFADTKRRINKGVERFEWGEHIDDDTLRQLENLLSYCGDNGIELVGFLTPYAPSIYDMMEDSGKYEYLDEIVPACTMLFKKYGFEFYDYMDGEKLDLSDDYYPDGFHGSEIVYGRILTDMVSKESVVADYVDKKRIDELISKAYSGYVIENPFLRDRIMN